MFARSLRVICAASALLVSPALTQAAPLGLQSASHTVTIYTMAPTGFGSRLAITGSSTGKILHTADGGQVFGFDVNEKGTDGLLATARTINPQGQVAASVETFDQSSMAITKVVVRTRTMDDFVTNGIFLGDVGLVEHEHVVGTHVTLSWRLLNPVTGQTFTGKWTPPNQSNFLLQQIAENQTTQTAAVFGTDFSGNPRVFSSNIAANTFGPVFNIDPNHFGLQDGPQLSEDVVHNLAVFATSPDGGTVGGQVPLIAMIDLATGAMKSFNGVVIPPFFSGFVNGLAVDSNTGIACTSTELDADVEFYTLSNGNGIAVGLPGANGNQGFSGEAVVNDPIHKLFLVVQPNGSIGPQGDSVIDIFNERGKLVKSITGFKAWSVTPGMVINPNTRTVFVQGPTDDALTQFSY